MVKSKGVAHVARRVLTLNAVIEAICSLASASRLLKCVRDAMVEKCTLRVIFNCFDRSTIEAATQFKEPGLNPLLVQFYTAMSLHAARNSAAVTIARHLLSEYARTTPQKIQVRSQRSRIGQEATATARTLVVTVASRESLRFNRGMQNEKRQPQHTSLCIQRTHRRYFNQSVVVQLKFTQLTLLRAAFVSIALVLPSSSTTSSSSRS